MMTANEARAESGEQARRKLHSQPIVISRRDIGMGWILGTMVAFGLLVSLVFPIVTSEFVIWRPGKEVWFRVACVAAGVAVSGFAYGVARFTLYRSNKHLAHLAAYDPLTGLANRRHFLRELAAELARASRLDSPVSLIIGDIDHFKTVNDSRGHMVGDEVLVAVSRALACSVRPFDTACRIGGEEFAVVMPQTDKGDALRAAERIRAAVTCASGPPLPAVTISLGVASFPKDADSLKLLVKRADDAMYRAKAAGRNRCRAWLPAHAAGSGEARPDAAAVS
jgi:diguanylate cyclase (GGDEF)-like protein